MIEHFDSLTFLPRKRVSPQLLCDYFHLHQDHREYVYIMNIYHEAFLCWGFKKALQGIDTTQDNLISGAFGSVFNLSEIPLDSLSASKSRGRFHGIVNPYFCQTETRFTRKKFETEINSSLTSVLSVRLREGYTVNSVKICEDSKIMEVKLTLPWKINSFIHYTMQAAWPINRSEQNPSCKIQVHLEGK